MFKTGRTDKKQKGKVSQRTAVCEQRVPCQRQQLAASVSTNGLPEHRVQAQASRHNPLLQV